jgi:catechol 2,3-dioxygenase-like lactoylglutathione lyase family enzyme
MRRLALALTLLFPAVPVAGQYAPPWQGRGAFSPQATTVAAHQPIGVTAVGAVGFTVSDMERSLAFYTGVLTFDKIGDREVSGPAFERLVGVPGARARVVTLRLGDEFLELTDYLHPEGRPAPADWRSNDRWFQHVAIIVRDMDSAFARLQSAGVRHASAAGPQTLPDWNRSAGGIRAFYFRDPDDHPLEILWFPPGKGLAKWQEPSERLFLGIDHTAIVVKDTRRSLAFYRDALGLDIAGASENYGPEQEKLNNVPGARLRITSLRADRGPGIEFLEYRAPRNGRNYPADVRSNDVVHWQTRLVIPDGGTAAARLDAERAEFVSPGAIGIESTGAGTLGLQVRDPDGHVLQLVEP